MKKIKKFIQISCDGGAATGKSTGAKMISKKYNLKFLSSGLLYRYASFLILENNPINKVGFLKRKFKNLNYKKLNKLNLHTPKISTYTSIIARDFKIRNILKIYQKDFIKKNRQCVLEGRDASTKILPHSDIKFFFICNLNIAAFRRYNELKKSSKKINFKDIKKALYKRDIMDKSRKISPLQKHRDAVVVNTGKLSKNAVLDKMSKHVDNFLKNKYGKNRFKR